MMDAEWNSTSPESMLDVVRQLDVGKSKLGRRKLRLFACACIRNWWDDLDTDSREALEITQQYALGNATRSEFGRAQRISVYDFKVAQEPSTVEESLQRFTVNGATNLLTSGAEIAGFCTGQHLRAVARKQSIRKLTQETERQIALLHEVFGDPTDPPRIDPAWLHWNNGAIPYLANEIYSDPQSGDYVQLRRNLKSAGCEDPRLLDHCRSRHPHVIGCWLLDALLGFHWPKPRSQKANNKALNASGRSR